MDGWVGTLGGMRRPDSLLRSAVKGFHGQWPPLCRLNKRESDEIETDLTTGPGRKGASFDGHVTMNYKYQRVALLLLSGAKGVSVSRFN